MFINPADCSSDAKDRIKGVEFKLLTSFPDDRGFFREVIRGSDPFFQNGFAQWSHSKMTKNTVKAWHYHHRQIDWWYVGIGVIHVALIDNRQESPTYKQKLEFKLGEADTDPQSLCAVVRIPQGVLHGCKVLTESAHLFYITSQTYDPQDEGRIPFNAAEIDHNWGAESELIVVDRDKNYHRPPYALATI